MVWQETVDAPWTTLPTAATTANAGPGLGAQPPGRALIAHLVAESPGISKTELLERTGFAWGTIEYHVRRMCRDASLCQVVDGRRVRLFPGPYDPALRPTLVSSRPLAARILEALAHGAATTYQLAPRVATTPKTVARHLEDLVALGLVERTGVYRPLFALASRRATLALGLREVSADEEAPLAPSTS